MSHRKSRGTTLVLMLFAISLTTAPVTAQIARSEYLTISGDVRAGYFGSQRDDRDGSESKSSDLRTRIRLGAAVRLSDELSAKVRLAGRFSTNQEALDFYVRDHAPTVDGLRFGDATIDEAYLNYRPSQRVNLRAGRFQSKFALADMMGKSLDRGDSPNTDITWTDGVHLTVGLPHNWNGHLMVQHNAAEGPTNVVRPPLSFSESRSRLTWFAEVESTAPWGPVVQRSLDVTYIPGALRVDGTPDGEVEGYVGIDVRGAAAWPVATGRVLVGGELGYAPNTPTREAQRIGDASDGRSGGLAFQLAVTLADAIEGHRFGIAYGQTQAGWLIAPDFRENNHLLEGRYQWQFAANHSFEARARIRCDLDRIVGSEQKRQDADFYLRLTSRLKRARLR